MNEFVVVIKQHPGLQQLTRRVKVKVPGKHFPALQAAEQATDYWGQAVEYKERHSFPRHAKAWGVAHSAPSLAEFGGVRIRVCAATSSGASEDGFGGTLSAAMRKQLAALETKAISSSGAAVPQGVLRHLLLCCDHTAAAAAVEEFCAVTRSGKPKQPGALLTMTVLKHRQMGGGAVWLGRVSGKPLPAAPASRLRALLDALDWGAMPADGKLRGEMAEQSFKLGLSTRAWGKQNGPYKPFAFKAAMGVWDAASVTRKHQELWDAASALIAAADPGYYWTSVQFNKNFRASRHRDDKDASYQVATAFGDYEGGELRVHGQEGILDVNTRDRFVRFDGRFEHEVLPYSGLRYSVIFFQLAPPWSVDPSTTEEGGEEGGPSQLL